jgi:radical SAM peptide maturase (CXXX-repeat target family)/CXXX repeat peptide maturase
MGNIKMGSMSPAWGGLDGMPKSITFCVTEDCNLACKYCYMTGKNRFKKMNFETAKKVVDYILIDKENFKEKSVIWEFIGGEAFVEIELVDKLTDYIKQQMFLLDHSWFNSYRLSFASNGILYDTPAVQNYIKKNKNHLSIGLSVDGNKIKHDLQRVRPNGEGSYDSVVKNVPLWLRQFPNNSTKATFSHDDIPYLKDSIISLWDIGIKNVSANVVFENVWEEGDDILIEQQLRELADYILENGLWDNYSVRFFDPNMGNPLTEEELSSNFCGAGKMLAIDCDGNFYPCQRFYGFSLNNRKGIIIGDANTGIIKDKLRPFEALSLKSQSPMECVKCEVASGCAWCTGCNYDIAETDTVYQRATSICKMHKATVRANKYFWDKFESITGLPSERKRLAKEREQQNQKFLQFITSDNITPHCAYRNTKGTNQIMTPEVFEKGMEFCEANGFTPAFLGTPHQIEKIQSQENLIIGKAGQLDNIISIYDNNADCQDGDSIGILLLNRHNISNLYELTEKLFNKVDRINLVLEDVDKWDKKDTEQYNMQLDLVVPFIAGNYNQGEELEINILTDIWNLSSMKNCDAGTGTFTLAPNGRIYMCPAFYFDDPDSYVGTLTDGICIKNPQLLELKNAPICSVCDVYNCNRCNYLNKKMTNEINTPSKMQCVISHIEREQSRKLQELLGKYNDQFENILKKISYNDPLEKLLQR